MTKLLFLACITTLVLSACQSSEQSNWHKTLSGIQYRVIHTTDSGRKASMMATAKVHVTQFSDSPFAAPQVAPMPVYQMVLPPAPYTSDPLAEVLTQAGVREGDSVIIIAKDNKRSAFFIPKIYIPGMDGLNTDSIIAVDKKKEMDQFISAHAALAAPRIESYLKSKSLNATKKPDNTFTEILIKGSAPFADSGKTAGIKFTITNLVTNKVINSNKDTAFHQPPVLEFVVGKGFMLKAVDRAIQQLGPGGHGRVYLPGVMAAGPKLSDPNADFTQDVVFEVEIVSVK